MLYFSIHDFKKQFGGDTFITYRLQHIDRRNYKRYKQLLPR